MVSGMAMMNYLRFLWVRSMSKLIFGYLGFCDWLGLLDDWWLELLPDDDAFGWFFLILVL
jgi:hypothetical protein